MSSHTPYTVKRRGILPLQCSTYFVITLIGARHNACDLTSYTFCSFTVNPVHAYGFPDLWWLAQLTILPNFNLLALPSLTERNLAFPNYIHISQQTPCWRISCRRTSLRGRILVGEIGGSDRSNTTKRCFLIIFAKQ